GSMSARVSEGLAASGAAERPEHAESLAQTCLDLAEVMFVATDRDMRVILINRKGCELLGYPEAEILGEHWVDRFVPARLREEVMRVGVGLLAGEVGHAEYYENPIVTRSGEERLSRWHN